MRVELQKTKESFTDLAVRSGISIAVASTGNPVLAGLLSLAPEIGRTLHSIISDFNHRQESPRRFGRAMVLSNCVVNGIFERLQSGEPLRDDDFFLRDPDRSPSDELYEATLEACIKQFEERKIPYIAKIYENAAFAQIAPATVNSLLTQANERSWRQYCLLHALESPDTVDTVRQFFRQSSAATFRHPDAPHLRTELERLLGRPTGLLMEADGELELTESGRLVVNIAGIDKIPEADIQPVLDVMNVNTNGQLGR